jgi:D-sedoheptulose 7-phosphate isomerase
VANAGVSSEASGPTMDFLAESRGSAYLQAVEKALSTVSMTAFARAVEVLEDARARQADVYVMGNGGSAALAAHLACDFVKGTASPDRPPLRVRSLADNVPTLTAWANDVSYERAFAEQLSALARPLDVVIAVSVTGRSKNILAGLGAARRSGTTTVGLLGREQGPAVELVDTRLHVDSDDYGVVETVHLALVHALTAVLRDKAVRRDPSDRSG